MSIISQIQLPDGTIYDVVDSTSGYLKEGDLAEVAFTNSYEDLDNKPTIPKITISQSDPSGGVNGDIWIKYS